MPMRNYHSASIKKPKGFDSYSYKKTASGVDFVIGWKNGKSTVQAVRFPKSKFDEAKAKQWLKDRKMKYKKFEPALKENKYITFKEFLEGANNG